MAGVGFTDFYDASTARQIAAGGGAPLTVVLSEINAIKVAIDTAAPGGALTVSIINSTTMTQGATYYEAWADPTVNQTDAHNLARLRMDNVVRYFARLGYVIRREREGSNNRLSWILSW